MSNRCWQFSRYIRSQINIQRFLSFGTNTENYIIIDPYSDMADCLAEEFLAPNDKQLILESTVSTVVWGDEY